MELDLDAVVDFTKLNLPAPKTTEDLEEKEATEEETEEVEEVEETEEAEEVEEADEEDEEEEEEEEEEDTEELYNQIEELEKNLAQVKEENNRLHQALADRDAKLRKANKVIASFATMLVAFDGVVEGQDDVVADNVHQITDTARSQLLGLVPIHTVAPTAETRVVSRSKVSGASKASGVSGTKVSRASERVARDRKAVLNAEPPAVRRNRAKDPEPAESKPIPKPTVSVAPRTNPVSKLQRGTVQTVQAVSTTLHADPLKNRVQTNDEDLDRGHLPRGQVPSFLRTGRNSSTESTAAANMRALRRKVAGTPAQNS